jgi:hypothetical protein
MPVILFRDFAPPPDQVIRVVVTGHMIDRGEQHRFPESFVPTVYGALAFWLKGLHSVFGRQLHLYTSASAGVDLLALAIALTEGIPTDVFLPQAEEPFLARSVAYGSHAEQWLQIYQAARAALSITIHEPVDAAALEQLYTAPADGSKQHYVDLNLELARLLRPDTDDRLIAVWDGHDTGTPGGTGHLVRLALEQGVQCLMLREGLLGADPRYDRTHLRYTFL